MKNFISVSTSAARFQDISLNPQKLAGQCAKLKCCLNYEADTYIEAQRKLPSKEIQLETLDQTYYFFKADILAGLVTYSTDKRLAANIVTLTAARAFEIIRMNKEGIKPERLSEEATTEHKKPVDLLEQDSLTRFDRSNKKKKNKKKRNDGPKAQTAEQPANNRRNRGDRRKPNGKPSGDRNQTARESNGNKEQ